MLAFFGIQQPLVRRQVCDADFFQSVFPGFEQRGARSVGLMAMYDTALFRGVCNVTCSLAAQKYLFSGGFF